MATGSFILRPNRDITLNHYTNSSYGYQAIREKVADDNSTYIYQPINETTQLEKHSVFGVSSDTTIPNGIIKVTRIKKVFRICSTSYIIGSANLSIGLNSFKGNQDSLSTSTYADKISDENQNEINSINAKIKEIGKFPTDLLKATIYTAGRKDNGKDSNSEIRVTQIYFEVFYETVEQQPINKFFIKKNNAWNEYNKIYKKENGIWVEKTFENIFGTLSNGTKTIYANGGK